MKIRDHRPKLVPGSLSRFPNCCAEVDQPTAEWHKRVMASPSQHFAARKTRWARRGLKPEQCTHPATYTIDRKWYCRKHAAIVVLDNACPPSNAPQDAKP